MSNQGVKGLLLAVVVLLLLNLAAQLGKSSTSEREAAKGRVVAIAAAHKGGDVFYLFRTFEGGRMEWARVTGTIPVGPDSPQWTSLTINDAASKPK